MALKRSFWRDPIDNGQMIDLTITWCKVNAPKKNKRVLFDGHDQQRIKTLSVDFDGKNLRLSFVASHTPKASPTAGRKRRPGPRPSVDLTVVEALGLKLPAPFLSLTMLLNELANVCLWSRTDISSLLGAERT